MWAEIPYSRDQCTSCLVAALRILPPHRDTRSRGYPGSGHNGHPRSGESRFWTSSDTEGGWRPRQTHLHGRTNLKQGSTGVVALKTDSCCFQRSRLQSFHFCFDGRCSVRPDVVPRLLRSSQGNCSGISVAERPNLAAYRRSISSLIRCSPFYGEAEWGSLW